MAALTHLDTHVLVWLFLPRIDLLSDHAREHIEHDELAVSPLAVLELTYLHEIGRLRVDGAAVLSSLERDIGVRVDTTALTDVAAAAHEQSWTRDPFDRLIASQAIAAKAQLLTKDETLHAHVPASVW